MSNLHRGFGLPYTLLIPWPYTNPSSLPSAAGKFLHVSIECLYRELGAFDDPKAGKPIPERTIEALVREKIAMIAAVRSPARNCTTAEEPGEDCDARELIRRLVARIEARADSVTIRFSAPTLTA
jgi:hypothetical protein